MFIGRKLKIHFNKEYDNYENEQEYEMEDKMEKG